MTEQQAPYVTIRFTAQIVKVSTLADGGIRVTLDLPETAIDTATQLMQVRQGGGLLEVAAVAIVKLLDNNALQAERPQHKSEWQT